MSKFCLTLRIVARMCCCMQQATALPSEMPTFCSRKSSGHLYSMPETNMWLTLFDSPRVFGHPCCNTCHYYRLVMFDMKSHSDCFCTAAWIGYLNCITLGNMHNLGRNKEVSLHNTFLVTRVHVMHVRSEGCEFESHPGPNSGVSRLKKI